MAAPAGWYRDPYRPSGLRYWNEGMWTDHVSIRQGETETDPLNGAAQLASPTVRAPLNIGSPKALAAAERRRKIAVVVLVLLGAIVAVWMLAIVQQSLAS